MPLIEWRCKNCNGPISVDSTTKQGVCPFCNTPYTTEDIINNYNYNYNIENANIKMVDEHSIEKKLENAEIYLAQLNNPQEAEKLFKYVTQNAPGDYRGWWGLVRTITSQFTDISLITYEQAEKYATNAFTVVSPEKKDAISKEWDTYTNKINSHKLSTQSEINETENIIEKLNKEITNYKNTLNSLNDFNKNINDNINSILQKKDRVNTANFCFIMMLFTGLLILITRIINSSFPSVFIVVGILLMAISIVGIYANSKIKSRYKNLLSQKDKNEADIINLKTLITEKNQKYDNLNSKVAGLKEKIQHGNYD